LYSRYREPPIMAHNSRYGQFLSAVDSWRTIHPILDMTPPLLAEEEGPPT
jgi:hypothetical protein